MKLISANACSSRAGPTNSATIALTAEQRTCNATDASSSLASGSKKCTRRGIMSCRSDPTLPVKNKGQHGGKPSAN